MTAIYTQLSKYTPFFSAVILKVLAKNVGPLHLIRKTVFSATYSTILQTFRTTSHDMPQKQTEILIRELLSSTAALRTLIRKLS